MKIAINIELDNVLVEAHDIVNAFKIFFGRGVKWRVDKQDGGKMGPDTEMLVMLFATPLSIGAIDMLLCDMCSHIKLDLMQFYCYNKSEGFVACPLEYDGPEIEFNMKKFIEL